MSNLTFNKYFPIKNSAGELVGKTEIESIETILDENTGLPIGYKVNDKYNLSLGGSLRLLSDDDMKDLEIIE